MLELNRDAARWYYQTLQGPEGAAVRAYLQKRQIRRGIAVRFGMRAAATNFDDNALREGIAYAHAHGVKCYITVNIMPSNRDLPALPAYLELLQDAGADADRKSVV